MAAITGFAPQTRSAGQAAARLLALPLLAVFAFAVGGLGWVAYLLWPRWPEAPLEANAPLLPIVIAGVPLNVPPAAIRQRVQRHSGAQERIDLVFLWPSLSPPQVETAGPQLPGDRVFLTLAAANGTLSPLDRLKAIYPRYTDAAPSARADGLVLMPFRSGTAYQGEDLLYDPLAPERFIARCSRKDRATPGTCLLERRVETVDVTLRFPRDWLTDWRKVLAGAERLIAQLRATAR
jgi:hypothetical protein